jgi:PHD/YefM family antitoxin component YafN of YafNO toxin-antitoxin module
MEGSVLPAKEAGKSLSRLLNSISSEKSVYITDSKGQARAVLLDIDKYHAMMDALEDEAGGPDAAVAGALLKAILGRARRK